MTDNRRLHAAVAELVDALIEAARPEPDRPVELLSVVEAARRLGVGRSMVYTLIGNGQLRSFRVGRRRLVPADAIRELVER